MAYTTTNQLSAEPVNCNVGFNNSWLEVINNAGRPFYAQGVYVTNLEDISLSLEAGNISIGSIEINDPDNHELKVSVASIGEGVGALRVLSQDLEPVHDTVSLGDVNENRVTVNSSLSALNVNVAGGSVSLAETEGEVYSFNNHSTNLHRGFTLNSDAMTPVLSIQTRPGFTEEDLSEIIEYELCNNNASSSTIIYEWYEGNVSISGPSLPAWINLGDRLRYRIYTDWNGNQTGHTFSSNGAALRHSGIIIGKNSSDDEGPCELYGGNNPNMLTLCMKRVDSSTKLDLWFAVTTKEY
jgi:hypothetical protein